jgi:hypothetical protein
MGINFGRIGRRIVAGLSFLAAVSCGRDHELGVGEGPRAAVSVSSTSVQAEKICSAWALRL